MPARQGSPSPPASPPEAAQPPKVTGDVYAGPLNKYLFRGNDLSGGKWVVQGGVDLYYQNWSFGYWTNYQGKTDSELGIERGVTETDIYLEYGFSPSDLVTCAVGNNLYSFDGTTTNELYLKSKLNTILAPTLIAYWDWDKANGDGLFFSAAVSHEMELAPSLLSMTVGALASYNQYNNNAATNVNYDPALGDDIFDGAYSGFHNYELSAKFDYKPTGYLTITPSYLFSDALSSKAEDVAGIKDQHLFSLKATLAF